MKKKTLKKIGLGVGIAAAVTGVAFLTVYIIGAVHYSGHFFPGTVFDGADIYGCSLDEAKAETDKAVADYSLEIIGRDGKSCSLSAADCSLKRPDDGLLEETLSDQAAGLWPAHLNDKTVVMQDFTTAYDPAALSEAMSALPIFDEASIVAPQNAYIAYDPSDKIFKVLDEVPGTVPIRENIETEVRDAVGKFQKKLILSDNDYENPPVLSDEPALQAACDRANAMLGTTIVYEIEGAQEIANADVINTWLTIGEDYSVNVSDEALSAYVYSLAKKYNTYGDRREFKTALGDTITIGGGDYGWVVDKAGEKAQILADLETGGPIQRPPVWEQTGVTRTVNNDIGLTYAEIDITNQHMYYFVNGTLTMDSDVVTGNINRNQGTPDGVFKIVYKQKNATLVGEGYSSPVDYFMPFAWNVGFHDASWRNRFGGDIYKTSGSHGCVNMPRDKAEELYNLIEKGTPVIVYYREPVQLSAENARISNAFSYVRPE